MLRPQTAIYAVGGTRILTLSSYCKNPTAPLPGCCTKWAGSAPGPSDIAPASLPGCSTKWASSVPEPSDIAPPVGLVCVRGRPGGVVGDKVWDGIKADLSDLDTWNVDRCIGGSVGMLEASPDCLLTADSGEGMRTVGSTTLAPSTSGYGSSELLRRFLVTAEYNTQNIRNGIKEGREHIILRATMHRMMKVNSLACQLTIEPIGADTRFRLQ